jgi:tetratricopeptide (TPR) repeat protein
MVMLHQKSPLFIIVALAVTILVSPWVTAQGIDDYYGWPHHPLTSEWEQRLWYADIYNFLYGNCECHFSPCSEYSSSNTVSENATSLMDKANVFYLTGSYEQAAESYAKALNIDPALSEGWLNLGNSLYFLGRYQASLDAYAALLNRDPKNENALAGKNKTLQALNNVMI